MLENSVPIQLDHDLGRFADITALQTQYPAGRPGDYARLTSTETIWYWNGSAWTDTNVSASQLSGGTLMFDNVDPATVTSPPAGKIFTGAFNGRSWTLESDGSIHYLKYDVNEWYGVEWDTENPDPACKRIGNMDYHSSLPLQNLMRRAVAKDDGSINYYLDPNDSTLKEDGSTADLSGADGQVIVDKPEFWWTFEHEGNKRRFKLAPVAMPGWFHAPRRGVGAYEASIDGNGILQSISGVMPTTNKTRAQFRAAALARGSNWHQLDYMTYLEIFLLYLTEYATFNIQSVIPGATNASGTDWSNYNGYNPVVATGVSNSYGNYTGSVPFTVDNFVNGTDPLNSQVADYRGIENIYGHIWKFIDGVNVYYADSTDARVYTNSDPATFADDDSTNYQFLGNTPNASGYIRSLIDNSWLPATDVGASSSTYMTDYHYVSSTQTGVWRVVLAGGYLNFGSHAGLLGSSFNLSSSHVSAAIGGRLCLKIQ